MSCQSIKDSIQTYESGGSSLSIEGAALASVGLNPVEGPEPQLLPRDGSTPEQIKCTNLAYILYLLEYHNPNITQQDAYDNYLENFDGCYPA